VSEMSTPQEIVERGLRLSQVDGCVVIVTEHTEANLRWAANSLTTNGQMTSRSVTVISTVTRDLGAAVGVVTRTLADIDDLADLVKASERAALDADPADDYAPLVQDYANDDVWDAPAGVTSAEVFASFAPALGAAFETADARGERLYGFAEHQLSSYFVGTSTGLRRRFDQPDGRVELNAKSADLARSAWAGVHTQTFADIDVHTMTEDLHTRLEWARTKIDLPAGRYETILPPTAVADLLIYAYWHGSARDAEEGRSVFAKVGGSRIGDRLSHLPLTMRSDPSAPGLQCPSFEIASSSDGSLQSVFDNGAPVAATNWIEDGTLRELIRTRSWAARSGHDARPAGGNLIVDAGGRASLAEMIAATERGLLLTCLWYIREVDPQTLLLTGLTRDGVYLIENGQVVGAVNNFRFNESPVDLLGRITEAGATVPAMSREWSDYFTRTAMPALRVPDFNMSTVSAAS
jgi:predicted Zn-dependent protease